MLSICSEGSMKVDIKMEDVKEYAIAEDTILTQSYSLKYVQLMCQFNKLSTEIKMGFCKNMPMTMKYELGEESYVMFYLAPKIMDDATFQKKVVKKLNFDILDKRVVFKTTHTYKNELIYNLA